MSDKLHLTIDGQSITAQSGQTILEAARAAGIDDIPVLCYHPALSNWGACRMCVVEVKGMRGLQTACTCPVSDGMEVETETEQVVNVRKFVLELLFSERNHYCMFCQMSGDCELQDLAYRYGLDHFTYPRPYEKLGVDASRKYFIMDQNRCILCSRCIRACAEVVANHTLNLRERGADSMVMADLNVPFGDSTCVECGTCLQVCPTGALVDAKSAYGGREKDVTHTETTCMQCSVGCALDVVTRYNRLLRVDGVWGSDPNNGLLCVDGRFKPLYEERKRVTRPLVRKDDKLMETSWQEALALVADTIKGSDAFVGIATSATTNEALEAFAALAEQADGEAARMEPTAPELGYGEPAQVQDILDADFIIVAGAEPLDYQRVIGYFIQRAADRDVPVALIAESENDLSQCAMMVVDYDEAGQVAGAATDAEKPVLVYSVGIKPEAIAALKPLGDKVRFLALDPARNGKGAEAAGLMPMEDSPLFAEDFSTFAEGLQTETLLYVLLSEQSEDATFTAKVNGAFTVVQASYRSPLVEQADVVLPTPIWCERTGHVTNLEGKVKSLSPALPMPEGMLDDAEVLKKLTEMISS